MTKPQSVGLKEFLKDYPSMMASPISGDVFVLEGGFGFSASFLGYPSISDSYFLRIEVPVTFPKVAPTVRELGGRIPRDGRHHINHDDTLCLGSPLRLLWKLRQRPTLVGFAEECLIPYLYGITHKIQHGTVPFGELAHGDEGVITDYVSLFGVENEEQALRVLELLGMKKRLANKRQCPCGCGRRLGSCPYHHRMIEFRRLAERSWFREHRANPGRGK